MSFEKTILIPGSTQSFLINTLPSWSHDFTNECMSIFTHYGFTYEIMTSDTNFPEIKIYDPNIRIYTRPMSKCHYCPEPNMYSPQYFIFYDIYLILQIKAFVMNWDTHYNIKKFLFSKSNEPILCSKFCPDIINEILSYV